jgi:hypothetical protein
MHFFTPALYVRFNSSDDKKASRANEEWENALASYQRHFNEILNRLPGHVRILSEIALHDAELIACDLDADSSFLTAILSLRRDDEIVSLIYRLCGSVRQNRPLKKWPFSKELPHWLYDEIDLALEPTNAFMHSILLSDGRVLEIPFWSVIKHRIPAPRSKGTAADPPARAASHPRSVIVQ